MMGHSDWSTHWVIAQTKVDIGNSNLILVQPPRISLGIDKVLEILRMMTTWLSTWLTELPYMAHVGQNEGRNGSLSVL